MIKIRGSSFDGTMYELACRLDNMAKRVDSKTWQSQSTEGRPGMGVTWELEDVSFEVAVPATVGMMAALVKPNLPWADEHFYERVGGLPLNPPPSNKIWPFQQAGHVEHTNEWGMFSHTYPERFWPKHAGHDISSYCQGGAYARCEEGDRRGVRYNYGDLNNVLALLDRDPTTRQAYLPVWFPEDTGSVEGQRVPCSLGYQFRVRRDQINCTYTLRSCDYLRHLRDDVYMAMRLQQWIGEELNESVIPGTLVLNIGSLHIFDGDRPMMQRVIEEMGIELSQRLMGAMG